MEDLTGRRFGKLSVLKRDDDYISPSGQHLTRWICLCDCGNLASITRSNLLRGTMSCGCMRNYTIKERIKNKGYKNENEGSLYYRWSNMKRRCLDVNNVSYHLYGGRGIKVCTQWLNYDVFRTWALNNGYSKELTLDRIDVNGNYEPDNCRWISWHQQSLNKQDTIYLTYNKAKHTLYEWSQITGIPYKTLWWRLRIAKWNTGRILGYEK